VKQLAGVSGAVHVRADDRAHDVGRRLLLLLSRCVQAVHAGIQLQPASHHHHARHRRRLLLSVRTTTRRLYLTLLY